jgi:hypothetical protein
MKTKGTSLKETIKELEEKNSNLITDIVWLRSDCNSFLSALDEQEEENIVLRKKITNLGYDNLGLCVIVVVLSTLLILNLFI